MKRGLVKTALGLAILFAPALWAEEAADRAAVEATISALNSFPSRPELFTADFSNTAELKRFQETVMLPAVTVVISRAPMGEATWNVSPIVPRLVTRSVTFISPDTAVVVATCGRESALFVVKNESSNWRIASFRVLPEAQTKPVL